MHSLSFALVASLLSVTSVAVAQTPAAPPHRVGPDGAAQRTGGGGISGVGGGITTSAEAARPPIGRGSGGQDGAGRVGTQEGGGKAIRKLRKGGVDSGGIRSDGETRTKGGNSSGGKQKSGTESGGG